MVRADAVDRSTSKDPDLAAGALGGRGFGGAGKVMSGRPPRMLSGRADWSGNSTANRGLVSAGEYGHGRQGLSTAGARPCACVAGLLAGLPDG